MIPFIIAGITTGSIYGLAGVGLVLTYKTAGIFNFAHGALATVSAFLFYALHVEHGMPWPLAAFVCVFVAGPVLGLLFERLARSLAGTSLAVRVVSTVGVLLIVQSIVVLIYGAAATMTVPQFLPTATFTIGGTPLSLNDLIVVAIGLLATVGLYVFFRTARTGVAMRAVVDRPELLDLAGTNPGMVRRYAWVIGVCFVSVSGVLLAPLVSLNSTTLTLLIVQAFGAAAVGRFTSLPMTYVGGLLIGIGSALATKYFTSGVMAGLPSALPFLVLFVVLVFSRRGRLTAQPLRPPHRASWRAPWPVQLAGGAVLLALLLAVPEFADYHIADWTLFLTAAIVFLSLGLLVRTSGQVSLAHVAFMAIGAAAFSHLTEGGGVPWGAALVIAGLVAIPIGALLAIPAIRLSGLYLALATFGFGILLAFMSYTQSYMFGEEGIGLTVPRPSLGNRTLDDQQYYYLVLALALAVTLGMVALHRSRLGRLLHALADSPQALATTGTSVNVTRVLVFCLSAFLAAVGGALAGAAQGNVSGDSYPPLLSLTFFALVVINPGGVPWFAVLAGAGYTLIPSYFPDSDTSTYLELLFGVFALLYAITPDEMRGVPDRLARLVDRAARPTTAPAAEHGAEPSVLTNAAAGEER
ncbi:ABC transporter permease [Streptomyces sp. NBC_01622]|uniref:branched-chain amino acid ABC transporter permease n=1 Tax=Streptomyces sp. NBC_01622 TaxID=2975903 RepID=UPI00386E1AC4|nr:ABC transporter permease [Streptomyces sp. NBC_01622]